MRNFLEICVLSLHLPKQSRYPCNSRFLSAMSSTESHEQQNIKYIKADELEPIVRSGLDGSGTIVVDVRSTDFAGGNIKGAVNVPSDKFYSDTDIDAVIDQTSTASRVVFHCAKSQQRGPFCATEYLHRLNQRNVGSHPEV